MLKMKKINSKLYSKFKDLEISSKAAQMISGGEYIATSSGRPNSSDCCNTDTVAKDGSNEGYQKDTTVGPCKPIKENKFVGTV